MKKKEVSVVTGAFGYTGKYIAKYLLDEGYEVRTLTNSYNRENPFGERVKAYPFNFNHPNKLVKSLEGAEVLYNTYWVRFNYYYKDFKQSVAIENTLTLFNCAKKAGVKRIVHTSITNPSEDSPFEYFRGKAILEKALIESGISYAILRPAVIFGKEDILINNIAWIMRNLWIFGIFGDGKYKLQPIYVEDFAKLATDMGKKKENVIIDAIGPETFTYRKLVKEIGKAIGKRRPIISIPDFLGYFLGRIVGMIKRDIIITENEISALKANLLYTKSKPVGKTKLTDWLKENSSILGARYHSELARRKNRLKAYEKL